MLKYMSGQTMNAFGIAFGLFGGIEIDFGNWVVRYGICCGLPNG
jgi:hypothetical protein